MSEWQPIETAPKDDVLLLFARHKHATASVVVVGFWNPVMMKWTDCVFSPNEPSEIVPSHWMRRPAFPSSKED